MLTTGKHNDYYWLDAVSHHDFMEMLITEFPEFILGKYLAVLAFDSDSFLPTEDELRRGWMYNHEIAYFDTLNAFELSQKSLVGGYDQWLIFDTLNRFNPIDLYVNYDGFSINLKESANHLETAVINRFWQDIEDLKPQKFILNGDHFIFGTNDLMEFEKIISLLNVYNLIPPI